MPTNFSRREFLSATAAAAAVVVPGTVTASSPASPAPADALPATRIRKIFLAKPVPTWPKPDLDIEAEIRRINGQLASLAPRMPGIAIEGGELYRVADQVPSSMESLGQPDGLLVFNLTSTLTPHIEKLASTGLPTILFSQPYSGHDWSSVAEMRQHGLRIVCLATSDFGEIAEAARLLRAAHLMKSTRILYVNMSAPSSDLCRRVRDQLGATIVHVDPERVNAAFQAVDDAACRADAQEWISGALKVVEPSRDDIAGASRLYLALRRIMDEECAQAVTINCLGLFAQKRLPAYPCLAFCKLNDLGLAGVCEGDLDSTLTQLVFTYAFGVPGYVSDPVIDTSNDTVIHAHCVSATRMDGPAGERAPYLLRSHMEDNRGVSLQVRMRIGQVITMAKLIKQDRMLISTGTIIDNPDLDRGCRTKITTKVANSRKLLEGYEGGLHRVIFYGDRVRAVRQLSGLMGFKVVEEV
jgi:L-fucose isomerase-like protein